MKLVKKGIFCLIIATIFTFAHSVPEYESPTIIKKDSPLNQPWNPRVDNMNDSSVNNYQRYKDRKTQGHLNNNLVRNFNPVDFHKWINFYEGINLQEKTNHEMIENISNLVAKSISLQSYINFKSGLVVKELALLDMKLKQIEVLENAIQEIQKHPTNPVSNLGSNLIWKSNLDSVVLETTANDLNYHLGYSSICEILDGGYVERVTTPVSSSYTVKYPEHENMYYPRGEVIGLPQHDDNSIADVSPGKRTVDVRAIKKSLKHEEKAAPEDHQKKENRHHSHPVKKVVAEKPQVEAKPAQKVEAPHAKAHHEKKVKKEHSFIQTNENLNSQLTEKENEVENLEKSHLEKKRKHKKHQRRSF